MVEQLKMPKERKELGAELRRKRQAKHISQVALAELTGVSTKQINHIEMGRNWPSMPVYITLCRALGIEEPK